MRFLPRHGGQWFSLLAALLLVEKAPAQAVTPSPEKIQPANNVQPDEFATASGLLKDFLKARDAFRKESTPVNGEALDQSYLAIAKARVHSFQGSCALEVAYDNWGEPNGVPISSWEYTFAQLAAWRKVRPDSAPAYTATGKAFVRYAWHARGGAFAEKVSEENFKIFHERIAEARKYLLEAEGKTGVDAELYRLLIDVSKAEGSLPEEATQWLHKAQKLDPLYEPAFTAMAESLMPRWGGEEGDLEKFSRDVLSKLEGDEGKMTHTLVAGSLCLYGHIELVKSSDSRERVHAGARLLGDKYPKSAWCQNVAAFVGLIQVDKKLCQQTFPIVEKNPMKIFWTARNYGRYVALTRPELPRGPALLAERPTTRFLAFCGKTGELATVGGDRLKTVSLWDAEGKKSTASHTLQSLNVFTLDATDEGSRLFLVYKLLNQNLDVAALMNSRTGELQVLSDEETKTIRGGRISADGKLAATIDGLKGDQVTIWDVPARKALQRLKHQGSQQLVEFSPGGKYLAVAQDHQTHIWNWAENKEIVVVQNGPNEVKLDDLDSARFIGFRGEDEALFYAHRKQEYSFVVCRLDNKKLRVLAQTGQFNAESFRLSPDRHLVAAAYRPQEGTPQIKAVQIWDLEHGKVLGETPPMYLDGQRQFDFSPDNSQIALCSPESRGFSFFDVNNLPNKPAAP